jgi:hypothetical protein
MTFETRTVAAEFEMRDDSTTGAPGLRGLRLGVQPALRHGPVLGAGRQARVRPHAAMQPDVRLLIDHEGQPLARTKSGTLTLSTDDHGLHVHAPLDPPTRTCSGCCRRCAAATCRRCPSPSASRPAATSGTTRTRADHADAAGAEPAGR